MPRYVVGKKSIIDGGTVLTEGDEIELTEALAERHGLLRTGQKPAAPPVGGSAAAGGDADKDKSAPKDPSKKLSAEDAIAAIGECKTVEEVKAFFKDEERVTVKDAAKAKIKELVAAQKTAEKEKK